MKNLKKVLALVLVVATLMGFATMASATMSEDYSDGDSITHVEAVDIMSTIGVFDGISGAFSGDSILTREQAAKIITYMILGKDDADALVASVAPYTDVSRDRWSAGSIAYCKNEGILAGVGNGKFEPDGKLTGVAFAKMCLVALGYDPDVQNLTGPQWAVNTSKLAIADAGISANLSQISLADEMSREDACQMAFNTLKADLVDYKDRGTNITIPGSDGKDIVISDSPSKAEPIGIDVSRVDERNNGRNIKDDEVLQFGERYFPKLHNRGVDHDSFGRPATTWHYKSEEIGTYVDTDQLVQSWTAKAPKGEMYNAIGGSIVDNLGEKNGYNLRVYNDGIATANAYFTESDTHVYKTISEINGEATTAKAIREIYFDKNSTQAAGQSIKVAGSHTEAGASKPTYNNIGKSGNGVLTELYMDDDDNVTVVMINTFLVKATSDYNSNSGRVNIEMQDIDDQNKVRTNFLPTYIENDDFDVTGVKEGDYLLITASDIDWDQNSKEKATIESVTPATVQTGTVTEYTETDDVTVGGTKYSYNRILGSDETGEEFSINSNATLILDTYGYIMLVDESVSSSSFVYIGQIAKRNGVGTKAEADAYFTDGTNTAIDVSKIDGERKYDTIAAGANQWYTFSGSTGGEYSLTTPKKYDATKSAVNTTAVDSKGENKFIKGNAVRFMSSAGASNNGDADYASVKADDKTIFVIKDTDDDVDSYTGIANVPSVTFKANANGKNLAANKASVHWICKTDSEYASYVFIDLSSMDKDLVDIDGGNTAANYMFILKSTGNKTHVEGKTYYKYTVSIDGAEPEERWLSDNLVSGNGKTDTGRLFYNVREDGEGYITNGKEVGKDGTSNKTRYRGIMLLTDSDWKTSVYYAKPEVYVIDKDTGAGYYVTNDTDVTDVAGLKSTIEKKGSSVLSIPALTAAGKSELIVSSKSKLNLVLGKDADDLLSKSGVDYEEFLNTNVNTINSTLAGYALEGRVYLVTTDDDDSNEIDTLWIYVNGAEKLSK